MQEWFEKPEDHVEDERLVEYVNAFETSGQASLDELDDRGGETRREVRHLAQRQAFHVDEHSNTGNLRFDLFKIS